MNQPISTDNGDLAWEALEKDLSDSRRARRFIIKLLGSIRLAIIDWTLPGLSGIQICQRLRTRVNAPYVYTIMFSARTSHDEKLMALDGGADDYLVKPCKPSELRARLGVGRRIIETALSLQAKEAEASPPPVANAKKKVAPSTAPDNEHDSGHQGGPL